MPETILFRGATVRYVDLRRDKSGVFVIAHLTADFSTPVREAMEWPDFADGVSSAKLEGALLGTHVILTPGDKALAAHEIQFDINEVKGFEMKRREESGANVCELDFMVRTAAEGVAAKLEQYVRRIGDHAGVLKVSYVKQEELPLTHGPSTGDDRQQKITEALADPTLDTGCTSCDLGLEAVNGKHLNGHDCTRRQEAPAEPSLAAPTAAERKKARKIEEEKKRKLREAGPSTGDEPVVWPTPNEHGAYTGPRFTVLQFTKKKASAVIEVLQLGPQEWIAADSVNYEDGGWGNPLGTRCLVWDTMGAAIWNAAQVALEKVASALENPNRSNASFKSLQEIQSWLEGVSLRHDPANEEAA
jgi:hypothetical protein